MRLLKCITSLYQNYVDIISGWVKCTQRFEIWKYEIFQKGGNFICQNQQNIANEVHVCLFRYSKCLEFWRWWGLWTQFQDQLVGWTSFRAGNHQSAWKSYCWKEKGLGNKVSGEELLRQVSSMWGRLSLRRVAERCYVTSLGYRINRISFILAIS